MTSRAQSQTRRKFLQTLSAGSIVAFGSQSDEAEDVASLGREFHSFTAPLTDGWEFRLDPSGAMVPPDATSNPEPWQPVSVPHTWQSLGRSPDYVGTVWYRLPFFARAEWISRHLHLEFEAVNHTAHVFVNGKPAGEHIGKGYTAFTIDVSSSLIFGEENTLLVRVDNRPGDRMLPRNRSYDWTDDGGIIRPVHLHVLPKSFVERVEIRSSPDLATGSAEIRIRVRVRSAGARTDQVTVNAAIRKEGSPDELLHLDPLHSALEPDRETVLELGPAVLPNALLWHFDAPHLYEALVELHTASGVHQLVQTFGIRRFEVRGNSFFLNGEKASLVGVERMAGSHPEFGMAETSEWIEQNHRDMKSLNCVFTRVHWPQDRRVLDFCDRHGILMQEEVPAWGWETFHETSDDVQHALEQNGLEQLREMIQRDCNHPSIVAWGLCNEVDGKNPRTRQFARLLSEEARRLDPTRLQTYASNSLDTDPAADMAGEFDFISTNEYFGSWAPGGPPEVEGHLRRIRNAFPGKPIVISEYGWCECQPKIMPGDENRVNIINTHTEVFRRFPEVAGAIYFDYNDYRTLVGDKGSGAFCQRVHGVVDLYATPKPSFRALRLQASPIETSVLRKSDAHSYELEIRIRQQLPGYTLRGYSLRWIAYGYDGLPMDGQTTALPPLLPGTVKTFEITFSATHVTRVVVDLVRPTGFSAATIENLGGISIK